MMLVSILIPCYNAERWITQCIESALTQSWPNKEIIVVDDGSTDDSLRIIQSFGDRIQYKTGPNRGGNFTRNRLLELAGGAWVQYVDADDYLMPDKISNQMECLSANPKADVIYTPALFEEWIGEKPLPLQEFPLPEPHDPWIHLARWRLPQTGGSLWKKQTLDQAGRWDEELSCCQEHDLYFRLLEQGANFVHCKEGGAVYRYYPGHTVSRRDPTLVNKTRLNILNKMLDVLSHRDVLTPPRLHAINITRFEIARSLWSIERKLATQIMISVHKSEPHFSPEGPASSFFYRCLYGSIGFSATEKLGDFVRQTMRPRQTP